MRHRCEHMILIICSSMRGENQIHACTWRSWTRVSIMGTGFSTACQASRRRQIRLLGFPVKFKSFENINWSWKHRACMLGHNLCLTLNITRVWFFMVLSYSWSPHEPSSLTLSITPGERIAPVAPPSLVLLSMALAPLQPEKSQDQRHLWDVIISCKIPKIMSRSESIVTVPHWKLQDL